MTKPTDKPSEELCAVLQHRLDLIEPKLGHHISVTWRSRGYQFIGWNRDHIMHWERYYSFTRANEFITFLDNVLANKALKERREAERAARQ